MKLNKPIDLDNKMNQILGALVDQCRARAALLISPERTWHALASEPPVDVVALTRSVEQLFESALGVAENLGGQPVSLLLHQSQRGHLHLHAVEPILLAVAFDDYGFAGRVRHEAGRVAEAAAALLRRPDDEPAQPTQEDAAYANNLIDRIFETK